MSLFIQKVPDESEKIKWGPQREGVSTLFILFIAFFARLIFYLVVKMQHPTIWSAHEIHINGWLDIAQNWVSGGGYSEKSLLTYFPTDHLQPTAARGPVPVLVLAVMLLIFKGNYFYPLFLCSWLLSSLSAVMLYGLARKIFKSGKMALGAAFLYCFYLPEMFISTAYAAASESLFTFLLLGYFLAVIRSTETEKISPAFAAGGLLGLACLCRPVVLYLPLLYAAWLVKAGSSRRILKLAAFLAAFFLCLAPWAIRNQRVFHKPILTTTLGGYNLLRHNAVIRDNEFKILTSEQFDPIARQAVAKAGYDFNRLNEAQLDAIFKREALEIIRTYPWRYLKLCFKRAGWLWYKINVEGPPYRNQNLMIYFFMFPGIILALIRREFLLSMLAFHFFYFILFHAAMNAQFRFICPMMPCGILMAVYAFCDVLKIGKQAVFRYNLKP